MANWLSEQLQAVGVTTQLTDLGKQQIEGQELPLPPVILGKIGNDKNKKTILVYGHFDVQPVSMINLSALRYIDRCYERLSKAMVGTRIHSRW